MLCVTPEITQKCAEGNSETPIYSSEPSISSSHYELPSDNCKQDYVRRSSLQNGLQSNKFPCEQKHKGCQWKQSPDHNLHLERTCRFKLEEKTEEELKAEKTCTNKCNDKGDGLAEKNCVSCRGIDVEIDFKSCDNIYENETGAVQLDYCFRIKGQENYQFYVKNLKTNQETAYNKIIGEGSLFLEIPGIPFKYKCHSRNRQKDVSSITEDTYQNLQTNKDEEMNSVSNSEEELNSEIRSNKEDSSETIDISSKHEVIVVSSEVGFRKNVSLENIEISSNQEASDILNSSVTIFGKLCNNCSQVIGEGDIYYCLFGHDSCKGCKGKPCILCQNMMGEPKTYCKNYHKGCGILQTQDNLTKHEIDCEFNNFRCPYPRCVFLNSLSDLKQHFFISHSKSLMQSNNILEVLNGKKDRKWYIYCYDSLFVCSYYYYGTHIEFILQYIGANDNARSYQYEVDIKTMREEKFTKRAMCAGWNDLNLCRGIYFDYGELTNCDNSRFQFTVNLKIVNVNNGLYTYF